MTKIFKKDAVDIIKGLERIPSPTAGDIKLCQVASTQCKSIEEFCEFMEVDILVFKQWVRVSKEFKSAYENWKEHATSKVEAALAKRAIGFTKKIRKDVLTRQGTVETLICEEYYPPSETAAQFWLKNRKAEDWKDAKQIDMNVQADVRAWLVNAMSEVGSDETEIIDLDRSQYLNIEQPNNSVGTLEPTEELNLETEFKFSENLETKTNLEIEIETNLENENKFRSDLETKISSRPDPGEADPIAKLNARWG